MSTPLHPDHIGPYRILDVLGHGGMGTVYRAEQGEPMKREVALKVLRDGLENPRAIARFEIEREALSMMEHPSIAHVFDAGVTEGGRPWVAMEYVRGDAITDYCAAQGLGLEARLGLMIDVCRAVGHAHQKGVIHRDLKPSNVLVTEVDGQPVVKVIDFGLARGTSGSALVGDAKTEGGMLVGTPTYMSPEQAAGKPGDVDTRTDVYGLGVLLYELVTGEVPHGPPPSEEIPFFEVLDQVLREDPLPPSARVSTHDASTLSRLLGQSFDVSTLRRRLHGDLDRVVLKALEKDRDARYASTGDLAADIERYLNHEPVLAATPSRTYRIRKFVRRHRAAVAATAAVVLALAAGLIASLLLYDEAEDARSHTELALHKETEAKDEARAARDDAEELIDYMLGDLRKSLEALGRLEVLDGPAQAAVAYYDARSSDDLQPTEVARHAMALARVSEVLRETGSLEDGLDVVRRGESLVQATERSAAGDSSVLRAKAALLRQRGELMYARATLGEAIDALDEARRLGARRVAEDPADMAARAELARALEALGRAYIAVGRASDAETAWSTAARHLELLSTQDLETHGRSFTHVLRQLAIAHSEHGRHTEARAACDHAMRVCTELLALDPVNLDWRRAEIDVRLGKFHLDRVVRPWPELTPDLTSIADDLRQLIASDPRNVGTRSRYVEALQALGVSYYRSRGKSEKAQETLDLAEAQAREVLALSPESQLGRDNFYTVLGSIGKTRLAGGDVPGALELLQESADYFETEASSIPNPHRMATHVTSLLALAEARMSQGDHDAAIEGLERAYEAAVAMVDRYPDREDAHWQGMQSLHGFLKALFRQGTALNEQYRNRVRETSDRLERADLPDSYRVLFMSGWCQNQIARALVSEGDVEGGIEALERTVEAWSMVMQRWPARLPASNLALAQVQLAMLLTPSDLEGAIQHARDAVSTSARAVEGQPVPEERRNVRAGALLALVSALERRPVPPSSAELAPFLRELIEHAEILAQSRMYAAQWAPRIGQLRSALAKLEDVGSEAEADSALERAIADATSGSYASAVEHFEEALRSGRTRDDTTRAILYEAAKVASLAAGEQQGRRREALASQSVAWLRADYTTHAHAVEAESSRKKRRKLERQLERHKMAFREHEDFAAVRESEAGRALLKELDADADD